MPCPRCAHCRALSNPAAVKLSGPPSNGSTADLNLPFYREFGLAYDRARELGGQPRVTLMAANPWLTASQCSAYLKRARALGFVQSPGRQPVTAGPVVQPAAATPEAVPSSAPVAMSRRGRRTRVAGWTPAQSADVFFDDAVQLRLENAALTGQAVTAEQVRAACPDKISDGQAQAALDWALASGYAIRAGEGVTLAGQDVQPATGVGEAMVETPADSRLAMVLRNPSVVLMREAGRPVTAEVLRALGLANPTEAAELAEQLAGV